MVALGAFIRNFKVARINHERHYFSFVYLPRSLRVGRPRSSSATV